MADTHRRLHGKTICQWHMSVNLFSDGKVGCQAGCPDPDDRSKPPRGCSRPLVRRGECALQIYSLQTCTIKVVITTLKFAGKICQECARFVPEIINYPTPPPSKITNPLPPYSGNSMQINSLRNTPMYQSVNKDLQNRAVFAR